MKKILVVLVVIVAAAGVCLPYINGMVMEKVVRQSAENMNQLYADTGYDVKVEIQDYERGFSTSNIEWKIDLGLLSNFYGVEEILFSEQASHGYTGVVSKTHLEKNPWFNKWIEKYLDGKNPLQITTVYPLKGDIVSTLVLDSFSVDAEEDLTAVVMPAKLTMSMDKAMKTIGSELTWQGGEFADKMILGNLTAKSRMDKISTHVWAGQSNFELARFQVDDGHSQVDLKKVAARTDLDYDKEGNRLNVSMGVGIDSLAQKGQEKFGNAFVKVAVNQVDVEGYEQIMKLYTSMVKDMMKDMGEKGFGSGKMDSALQQQAQAHGMKIAAEMERLLKEGLELKVSNLKARLPQGQINGQFSLTLKQDMTMARFMPVLGNPDLVLDIFELSSNMSLPLELVGNNPNLFQPLFPGMTTGLFVPDADRAVHEAQTREGKLFLNQKEVMLDLLLQ